MSKLEQLLVESGRTKWLDVGSGGKVTAGFDALDVLPSELFSMPGDQRYFRADIRFLPQHMGSVLGKYDLVRMQHVLEHLTFEDGLLAIKCAAKLLKTGGLLLITTPDLRVHVSRYLTSSYLQDEGYAGYAQERIPANAPPSAYFSVFAHSLTYEPHRWCYDYEGLAHQVGRSSLFESIRCLNVTDEESDVPFTHNRPAEDVCLLAARNEVSFTSE